MAKSIWAHKAVVTPERKLWRGVLTEAFDDAEMTPTEDEMASETFECSRARQYLRADNLQEADHLKRVCEYAEIPADRVILWARRRYLAEATVETFVEHGSAGAAFPAGEASLTPQKRELGSRTPKNCSPDHAVVVEEALGCFSDKALGTEN